MNPEEDTWVLEPEGMEEPEYCTPKPNEGKTGSASGYPSHNDPKEDEDESEFVSPLKARKKPAPVADSDSELTGADSDDGGLQEKRKGYKEMGTGTGRRAFCEMVQEKRAMTTAANNKRAIIKPAGNLKVRHHL